MRTTHRLRLIATASAGMALGAALLSSPASPAHAEQWEGNVAPIIDNAKKRVAALSDAEINGWFGLPAKAKVELSKGAVNALPSVRDPKTGKDLGRLQVIYNIGWPNRQGQSASMYLRYRDGQFRGYQTVEGAFVGSFGFRKPKTDLQWTIQRTRKWVANHPGKVPSDFGLKVAQLQKADAPPPLGGTPRWVVTYGKAGMGRQVLVYMDGKVEFGGQS